MAKYRSLDLEYKQWIIKEYKYWTLVLHDDQRYLGRCYVWLVREGVMQRFSQISDEENAELRTVISEYETAIDSIWSPDFINYAWLANHFHKHGGHGHLHLIPRYKESRSFAGADFIDGRWGQNFTPSEEFKPAHEILLQICDTLKNKLV